jgi:hypothetical protein
MKRKAVLASALALFPMTAWAQNVPKPGPEVKKLEYFVGSWTVEATIGQGPWGAGGKFTSQDKNDWMPGGFFLEGHSDFKMPPEVGGDGTEIAYMGYDTDKNLYTFDAFSSQGRHQVSQGTFSGDTWTWNSEASYEGTDIKQKMTMKIVSPTVYNMKFEISMDGTTWMTFMEGKATKK